MGKDWYIGDKTKNTSEENIPSDVSSYRSAGAVQSVPGANGSFVYEPYPTYYPIERAKVISNGNSYITLGASAEAGPGTGYSKFGGGCSAVDIVVGRLAAVKDAKSDPDIFAMDSFSTDAARVYISQKTDIDKVMNLTKGSVGNSVAKSAVGIISDSVRILGRSGIKLVTAEQGSYLSNTGKVKSISGIDLIAGNDGSDMQPIPKGDNLQDALEQMNKRIGELASSIVKITMAQIKMYGFLTAHTHVVPIAPGIALPSIELAATVPLAMSDMITPGIVDPLNTKFNAEVIDYLNYLNSMSESWINSKNNRTN